MIEVWPSARKTCILGLRLGDPRPTDHVGDAEWASLGWLPTSEEEPMTRRAWIEGVQEWLYVVIVVGLTLYLVIGVIAWTWMIVSGIPAPDAFVTILAAITGALAGIVTPLQPPGTSARRAAPPEPPS